MAQKPATTTQTGPAPTNVSDDTILKIAKEIAVKFIEVGRLTPATFDDTFKNIYDSIKQTVFRDERPNDRS